VQQDLHSKSTYTNPAVYYIQFALGWNFYIENNQKMKPKFTL